MYNDCEEPLRTEEECMMVLSITDFSETQNFSIFPNPTTGAITIEGNGLHSKKTRHPFGFWRGFADSENRIVRFLGFSEEKASTECGVFPKLAHRTERSIGVDKTKCQATADRTTPHWKSHDAIELNSLKMK